MSRHKFKRKHTPNLGSALIVKNVGDSLIEVLVTLFITSVGVLGASSMQMAALKNFTGAQHRDLAVMFAENLSESMKALGPNKDYDDVKAIYISKAEASLPSGQIATSVDTDNKHTITIRWDENRNNSQDDNCPVVSSADLDCHRIVFSP